MMTAIERLWGVIHEPVTPNKCDETSVPFADAALGFPREKFPGNGRISALRSLPIFASWRKQATTFTLATLIAKLIPLRRARLSTW
jgi:hypothetical protein